MATSALYRNSSLSSPSGSPRSCLYMPRHPSLQPKADWRASFTDTNRENREEATYCRQTNMTKPLILRQHNGVWLPRLKESFAFFEPAKPQPESTKASRNTVTSPSKSRLSLGRVASMLRCHVCLSTVKEQHFHNHLFFGPVRCELCSIICQDCRVFEWLCQEAEVEYSKCQHRFAFCEDPCKYLLARLCGSDDSDLVADSALPHNLRILQNYVNKLASLALREPWSNALRMCKSHLLKSFRTFTQSPLQGVSSQEDPNSTGSAREEIQNKGVAHTEREELGSSIRATLGSLTCSSPAREDVSNNEDSEEDGLLLTQTYDLEHLEQAVEYVELEEHSRTSPEEGLQDRPNQVSKPKKRRKSSHRQTPKKRTPPPVEQGHSLEEDLVMEEVELPEDGYYLMVNGAVEECPMCYEQLRPTMCTVNTRTFLFTVQCPECNLVIYMVPPLSDGLKIVTEDSDTGVVTAHNRPTKSKTKSRKISPRDFFAA